MKKVILTQIAICTIFSNCIAQSASNIYFPDGIVVGPTTLTIPEGSPYKMAVAGGILTEKVRVATNGSTFWADFVFDKNYKLMPLSKLEKYIKANNHLPEIPSTKEVNENGIDLAVTQALLLQKIEELSLYAIEQNKKIEKLDREIRKLKKKK